MSKRKNNYSTNVLQEPRRISHQTQTQPSLCSLSLSPRVRGPSPDQHTRHHLHEPPSSRTGILSSLVVYFPNKEEPQGVHSRPARLLVRLRVPLTINEVEEVLKICHGQKPSIVHLVLGIADQ